MGRLNELPIYPRRLRRGDGERDSQPLPPPQSARTALGDHLHRLPAARAPRRWRAAPTATKNSPRSAARSKRPPRNLEVPIVALAQLNRARRNAPRQAPDAVRLARLGLMEQEADIVAFLYRDDYYNPETCPSPTSPNSSSPNTATAGPARSNCASSQSSRSSNPTATNHTSPRSSSNPNLTRDVGV